MLRDFKGIWIPRKIWINKDLNLMEKVMLAEIGRFESNEGCFFSNAYFADFFNVSKRQISRIISGLVERGYITSEIEYEKDTRVVKKRVLKVLN